MEPRLIQRQMAYNASTISTLERNISYTKMYLLESQQGSEQWYRLRDNLRFYRKRLNSYAQVQKALRVELKATCRESASWDAFWERP